MVLLQHDAGVRVHGSKALFSFASEKVLPHFARALGFKSAYPEYASRGGRGGAVGIVDTDHSEL
jgi:hypothetical protein